MFFYGFSDGYATAAVKNIATDCPIREHGRKMLITVLNNLCETKCFPVIKEPLNTPVGKHWRK